MTLEEVKKLKPGTIVRIKKQPKGEFLYGYFETMPAQGTIVEVKSVEPSDDGGVCVDIVSDSRLPCSWGFHYTDLEYVGEINRG